MEIRRDGDVLEIAEIDPFLAELLRQIPESTSTDGNTAAENRLFSRPAAEAELCAEWKLYVEPELRRLFAGATEVVQGDLRQLDTAGDDDLANCTLRIPAAHAEAWLSALNQARLALAAKHAFTEAELCDHFRSPMGSRRDLSLFQVNFYGFLQEFILEELRHCSGASEA